MGEKERAVKYHFLLLAFLLGFMVWSFVGCYDLLTWFMEAAPVIIALPILIFTYKKFPLTNLLYSFVVFFSIILLTGAHYTYSREPIFNWIRDTFELSRNHFDRFGHFFQGVIPALAIREMFIRQKVMNSRKWQFFVILCVSLAVSASYELVEWISAELNEEASLAFLGSQGDNWDAQKDMGLCLLGALCTLLFLPKIHDKQIARIISVSDSKAKDHNQFVQE